MSKLLLIYLDQLLEWFILAYGSLKLEDVLLAKFTVMFEYGCLNLG